MIKTIWRPKNWDEVKRKLISDCYEEKRAPTFLDGVEIGASAVLEALEETRECDIPLGHDLRSLPRNAQNLHNPDAERLQAVSQPDSDLRSFAGGFLSSHIDNKGALFTNAENDLRKRITEAVERIIKSRSGVPLTVLCSPVSNGYKVRVRSTMIPDQFIEATLSESSLYNLDSEWQKFCSVVLEAFTLGFSHP